MQCGLNLYSVRSLFKDRESLLEVCLKAKEIGYRYLQFSGMKLNAADLASITKATGLPFVLTHVPMDDILNRTEELVEEHRTFGCTNIGLGMMPIDILKDEEKFYENAEALNAAGERMARAGAKLFYHFHQFEFSKHRGKRMIDYLIDSCPYINFTADTYWIQYGGGDIVDHMLKMAGRMDCIHLKDYRIIFENNKYVPQYAPIGEGNLNFEKIIKTAAECGVKYFLVEQDDAVNYPDPLGQVKISADEIARWQQRL